jgi:hypothetical protein
MLQAEALWRTPVRINLPVPEQNQRRGTSPPLNGSTHVATVGRRRSPYLTQPCSVTLVYYLESKTTPLLKLVAVGRSPVPEHKAVTLRERHG